MKKHASRLASGGQAVHPPGKRAGRRPPARAVRRRRRRKLRAPVCRGACVKMEPGAPPPATTFDVEPSLAPPAEPSLAPPPGALPEASVGDTGMMAEASSWFSQSFNLVIFGKRVSSDGAKTIIMGAGAVIVILVVVLAVTLSGSDGDGQAAVPVAMPSPAAPGRGAGPAPAPTRSVQYDVLPDAISLGCFEAGGGLSASEFEDMPEASASPSTCAAICDARGLTVFGLLQRTRCICGTTHSSTAVDASRCNTPCPAAAGVMCGGHDYLSVYSIAPPDVLDGHEEFTRVGCYLDDEQNRDLTGLGVTMGQAASPATCAALCAGYPYFGLQYYSMCFCGTTYGSLGKANPQTLCNTPCDGHEDANCGGLELNAIYRMDSSSLVVDVISGGADETFEYVGCYVDAEQRSMNNNNEANGNEAGAFGDLG
eukprot:COSAG06_NODE_10077_length_1756_cov_1.829813_1_plen_425_part_10